MPDDLIGKRLQALIGMGEAVLATRRAQPPGVIGRQQVDQEKFQQWRTSSLSFLTTILGPESVHYREFSSRCEYAHRGVEDAQAGVAVLRAAKDDIEGGSLVQLKTLAFTEVFDDFLGMADHLLEQSYKDPAAFLYGAVLEEAMRKLALARDIIVNSGDDMGALNQKLADKAVYSRLVQKQVQALKAIRDAADHGRFSEYDNANVRNMGTQVRELMAKWF